MSALQKLLQTYRDAAVTEREKGTYFEELVLTYLRHEAVYRDLYQKVWTYAGWAAEQGIEKRDTGIDLVAQTHGTEEFHAIQCKFYAEDYRVQKKDIDSFFTASGKKPFTHRVIVTTTNNWTENAEDALMGQQPPVTKIDLYDLENSQIDWAKFQPQKEPVLKEQKKLRPHQERALKEVTAGFKDADRGKMIMACGTGKTFTALKLAEELAGKGKRVLFLVPSLSLLSQTLTEWTQESETPLHSFAVCSDSDVGKKRKKDDDIVTTFMHELRYPATTNAASLANEMQKRHDATHMSVVFSTYHSIEVISKAQKNHDLGEFDLIICDEAHRTTGATFDGEEESAFVKVHDNGFLKGKKRLYMTATPRIYGDTAQATAERDNVALCSMDDEALYGKELYVLTFSEAVTRGLLVDYKVLVLTIDEAHVSKRLQSLLAGEDNQLKVDDAGKIIGCWKALSKQEQDGSLADDDTPMKRAVAFCQVIEPQDKARTHKVSSKNIANMFQAVVEAYQEQEEGDNPLRCEASHVDGSMNATEKEAKLEWLKEEPPEDTCRILSNVRCLSEGVDVPALDAVLFLSPRKSQVDVVQSVGRIMRIAPGKKRGYVILPVVIPAGTEPHEALNDNKTFEVVWKVLQALRSHDDRFDAMINKLDLIGKDHSKMEVIAVTDKINKKTERQTDGKSKDRNAASGGFTIGEAGTPEKPVNYEFQFEVGALEKALYAKLVQKCGNRLYWEDWAKDIAKIAQTHITRIRAIVGDDKNVKEIKAFNDFADELRDDLNDSITNDEVIEMLAQHLITKPVFDALFKQYSFASNNPVSQAMQHVLDVLQEHRLDKEADTLERFYHSVQMRAEGIDSAAGKQKIIVELYDKFFRNAFPKMTEKLGIVYTPVEVVDFIIHSVNDVLQSEFGETLGSKGVHIIDPFTGTGTFITRLLQSGLIKPEELPHKYRHEIHANEIVLLAYYIAAINIEAAYHGIAGGDYQPFEGICLTDTFQLYEADDLISKYLADNSDRRMRQKELDIRVIIGNPPYSAGQKNENDNSANVDYPSLDDDIRSTYVANSTAKLKNALYDSYIRAIRWGSDRLGKSGVMAYVSNAGWIDGNAMDGLRKCLAEEYSSIYVFHLRGNQRTQGELSRKEGGKIFGSGSRAPIAITLFVKNPKAKEHGKIYFHDIGDYLTQQQKLDIIRGFKSVSGIAEQNFWQEIVPDDHNDWINQRDDSFDLFIVTGNKGKSNEKAIFENYSLGLMTTRDAWCFNYSAQELTRNIIKMVSFYNTELDRYIANPHRNTANISDFVSSDGAKIKWSNNLKGDLEKNRKLEFNTNNIRVSLYRPFSKQWVYFDRSLNERQAQLRKIFPSGDFDNLVICTTGTGETQNFSALMCNAVPEYKTHYNGQNFPLKIYESSNECDAGLFAGQDAEDGYRVKDGITDEGLAHFKAAYPGESITKEDIFYYIYGLLHSEEYRTRYADNLSKQLPRIPCVKKAADFWTFSKAGRDLAELHVGYESVKPYEAKLETGSKKLSELKAEDYYVTKMKFKKKGDKTKVVYNARITISDIPEEAYDYVVNGKPALEWVMDRQCVKTDKASGIVNDANLWATETMGNAKYPLELFLRVITVSLETMKIVRSLPKLDIATAENVDEQKTRKANP
ncbi:MAG: DEAD/DEAH box helicase [Pseudomonadota bacterium]|nr:DEAD/DEAH box helicase [Pseudomonadota bacterium]QKK05619.1 MAG: DEAD/DEAH box helicase [Pseudomonadota bacterium]